METAEFIWNVVKVIMLWWLIYRFLCFCSTLHKAVSSWRERNEIEKEVIRLRLLSDKGFIEKDEVR